MKKLIMFLAVANVVNQASAAMEGDVVAVSPQDHSHKMQSSVDSIASPYSLKTDGILSKNKSKTPQELTEQAFGIARSPTATEADFKKAFDLMYQAAKDGFTIAQYHLSTMYADGIGTEKDAKQSTHWCKKAADDNHPNALNEMGINYQFGIGVDQDAGLAEVYFQKAIERDVAIAKENLKKLKSGGW